MRNALQRKLRAKRFKTSKTKFLPALGIFNKQRNSKPVFKSAAARRSSQGRRLSRQREKEEEQEEEDDEEDEEESSDDDDDEEEDDDEDDDEDEEFESEDEPTPAIAPRRRKRRSSTTKRSKKVSKKPRKNAHALREVSYNKFSSKKGAASKAAGRRGSKLGKPAGKSNAKGGGGGGGRREIAGLEIRANRNSLQIERHNNLAYFNRIQDELRDLVQQRDTEADSSPAAASAVGQDEAATPGGDFHDDDQDGRHSAMEYEDEVDGANGEHYGDGHLRSAAGGGHRNYRERERHHPLPPPDRGSQLHSGSSARAPARARSPSTESVYSHRSAASAHSLVEPPLARSRAARSSFAREDAYGSRSLTPRSEFRFDAAASEPPRSCRSTPASLLASPHSPTPPTPFVDPAATALGLHDPDPVDSVHSRSSRISHTPAENLSFDAFSTPRDFSRHVSRRSAGMSYGGGMEYSEETPRGHRHGQRYGDALDEFENDNDDDMFSLPSLSQTPAAMSGRATARSHSLHNLPDFDISTPTPPLFQRSKARMGGGSRSPHMRERDSSRSGGSHMFDEEEGHHDDAHSDFSFAAGSSEFRLRARRGF